MRFAAVAGLVALAAPIARGEFSCYEWPSKSDPMANVAYLIATDCDADMTALSKASGFSHLQEFGQADYTESSCTNSAGMVYFADLCNHTAAALVSIATPRLPPVPPCAFLVTLAPASRRSSTSLFARLVHNFQVV